MKASDSDYDDGFQDGLRAAVDLLRAGCTADELGQVVLANEPADRDAYQAWLGQLRQILGTDRPELFQG